MKKNKLFVALACLGLLVTGCNKGGSTSASQPSTNKPSTSSNPPASQTTQNPQTTTSQQEEPPADDDYYYSLPFATGYESVKKWDKGGEWSWTFKVSKAHAKVDFAFAAQMSSSSHGDRSLFTNHEGASSSDSFESNEANDGTARIEVKLNGVAQTLTTKTYEEAGLTASEPNYFRVASFAVSTGENVITMKTHAQTGYRLLIGEEARLFYPKADGQDPAYVEPQPAEGYTVTFATSHCKVLVYQDQDYTVDPVEATSTLTRDSNGKVCKYVAPDADGNGEVKPQVNFKVVADDGYKVTDACITVDGTAGTDYNNVKGQGSGIYRITVIKKDLTVTIAAIVDDGGQTIDAGKVTFALTNCTVKVYVGPKNDAGDNIDAGPDFYGRNKNEPYGYAKGDDAQFHFEVVPNTGFKFVDETDYGTKGEAEKANVAWADGSFNKVKLLAENYYRLTKVAGDVTLTIACVAA